MVRVVTDRRHDLVEIPHDWKLVPFGDTLARERFRVGKVKQSDYRAIGRFPIIDQGHTSVAGYWDDEADVYQGPLPVIVFGDHTRAIKLVDVPFVCGADGTKVLLPNTEQFDPRFLFFALQGVKLPSRGYNRHFKLLREQSVPCPLIGEQQRIAAILRAVQQAKDATKEVITATRELKRSLSRHLFTYGPAPIQATQNIELEETGIGRTPRGWPLLTVEDIVKSVTVGIVVRPASYYVQSGVPAFRSLNVREDRLVTNDLVFIDAEAHKQHLAKSALKAGDVLVVRTGYPGTSCVVPSEFDGANCIDIVIVRPRHDIVSSEYLSRYFNSELAKRQFLAAKVGLAQQHLNVGALKRAVVPVPPLAVQQEVVAALQAVDRKIEAESQRRDALSQIFNCALGDLMSGSRRVRLPEAARG